jgi:hypothetical protein
MGRRKIRVAETAAESIAAIALYIEGKGIVIHEFVSSKMIYW